MLSVGLVEDRPLMVLQSGLVQMTVAVVALVSAVVMAETTAAAADNERMTGAATSDALVAA